MSLTSQPRAPAMPTMWVVFLDPLSGQSLGPLNPMDPGLPSPAKGIYVFNTVVHNDHSHH